MRVYHLYLYCSLTACSLVERSQQDGAKGYIVETHADRSRRFVTDEQIREAVPGANLSDSRPGLATVTAGGTQS